MDNELISINNNEIKNLIYTIRNKQVMLDSDVAKLYDCETKRINEVVKRNVERFPRDFCFKLTNEETLNLRSQFATLNLKINNGKVVRKYTPYVFTEQGIIMLAGLLKTEIAIKMSVIIVETFVRMKQFINNNGELLHRVISIENKMENKFEIYDKQFDKIFNALQTQEEFKQKVFFEGQIYDAYSLIIDIIKLAKEKIVIIDNYIDESLLSMLSKKKKNVEVIIITGDRCKITELDIKKFNSEYPYLQVIKSNKFHDRFIVIDNKILYHCGASIKDLGKKCFGINKFEDNKIIKQIVRKFWLKC